ncbi:MAG: hypothetical protein R3C12_03070 [Planctomycetaceae bacterium]
MTSSSLNLPGLPAASQLRSYRIWDACFTPAYGHQAAMAAVNCCATWNFPSRQSRRGSSRNSAISRMSAWEPPGTDLGWRLRAHPQLVMVPFERWPDRLLGMIQVNAWRPMARGHPALDPGWRPMIGAISPGVARRLHMTCTHRNVALLVEAVVSAGGVIRPAAHVVQDRGQAGTR